jgi:hypothetical protein
MSIAMNYSYGELRPLIKTLRATGFKGEVVLFYQNLTKKTLRRLKRDGIKLIEINPKDSAVKGSTVVNYRFRLYHNYLNENKGKYNLVFLLDSRDIVFQTNPSSYKNYGKLNFFLESKKIRQSESNLMTFEKIKGRKVLQKYWDNYVSCAGTTIGSQGGIMRYLELMVKNNKHGDKPYDQALHNFLIHSGKFSGAHIFKNFSGPVITVGNSSDKELHYNAQGMLKNKDGLVAPIIHQYDRKINLLFKFNNLPDFIMKISKVYYIKFKRMAKVLLFRLPFIGQSLKARYNDPIIQARS